MRSKRYERTKSQLAYRKLKELIIKGEFGSDNRWSLRKLAREFGMSVVPITEALRRLEQEGIIDVRPQRGITVKQLTPSELREVILLREAIEVQVVRILCKERDDELISRLDKIADRIQRFTEKREHKRAAIEDIEFHRSMVKAIKAKLIEECFERLVIMCMVNVGGFDIDRWAMVEREDKFNHKAIVEALKRTDPNHAEMVIRGHIKSQASL